jgi:hypothetical protein
MKYALKMLLYICISHELMCWVWSTKQKQKRTRSRINGKCKTKEKDHPSTSVVGLKDFVRSAGRHVLRQFWNKNGFQIF